MEKTKNILAVSWITQYCQATVRAAVAVASKFDAELSVIHVVDTQLLQGWNLPFKFHDEENRKELEHIKAELNTVVNQEKKQDMKVKTVVKEGNPVEEILKYVEKEKIDLIVLREHEKSRIEQFMVGSSNDEIIRKMPCSILLLKSGLKKKAVRVKA
jgi:universal stress protein A